MTGQGKTQPNKAIRKLKTSSCHGEEQEGIVSWMQEASNTLLLAPLLSFMGPSSFPIVEYSAALAQTLNL